MNHALESGIADVHPTTPPGEDRAHAERAEATSFQVSPSTRALGFSSALTATVCSIVYVLAQLAEWLGWLGSHGGPESSSTPLGLVVLLTPSLVLGSAFLTLMVAIHDYAAQNRKVWAHAAIAFATVYTVLISLNYFVQLTWIVPRLASGQTRGIEPFLFAPFDSFLYSVDILGYSFMSVATLFAARVFTGQGSRAARALVADGQWALAAFHRVADVRSLADLARGLVGRDISGGNLGAGHCIPSSPARLTRVRAALRCSSRRRDPCSSGEGRVPRDRRSRRA